VATALSAKAAILRGLGRRSTLLPGPEKEIKMNNIPQYKSNAVKTDKKVKKEQAPGNSKGGIKSLK
jgi:hypothetical protein